MSSMFWIMYLSAAAVQTTTTGVTTASPTTVQTTASDELLSGKYHKIFITFHAIVQRKHVF